MAEQSWANAKAKTDDDVIQFFESDEGLLWEHIKWHVGPSRTPYKTALKWVAAEYPPSDGFRRVLDFGAGVGSDALFLAERSYNVTLVDVDGPMLRFAQHRFARRGLRGRFVVSRSVVPEPDDVYDIVICFDVFEHLPDPYGAAQRLVNALRPGGLLLQYGNFESVSEAHHRLVPTISRYQGDRWYIHLSGFGLTRCGQYVWRKHPVRLYRAALAQIQDLAHIRYLVNEGP